MIQYSLQCSQGHRFDAWFRNAAAYDEQQVRGIVACALCGDAQVEKAPMAPSVARTDQERMPVANTTPPDVAQMRELLRLYRQKVMSEADNVGDRFAEEARKMHFEESDARGIYGQATREEVAGLIEDGIDFLPLPDMPEDHN